MKEVDSYSYSSPKQECGRCKALEYDLEQANKTISVYHKNVCSRRGTEDVWLEEIG